MRGALLWFGAAMLLAAAELVGAEFFLLMLALGALAGAIAAGATGDPFLLPAVTFAVVSIGLIVFLRPVLRRRFVVRTPAGVGLERVIGASAVVVEPVDDQQGRAKVGGEIWSARAASGSPLLPAGTEARVIEVRGATVFIERG